MIIMIGGPSHTGKTVLAQRLLELYHYPYLSIDHLKMGLIRSGQTHLTPTSHDSELTPYLWGIVREIIKTAIENGQNLIVEGCYIPFDWKKDFEPPYLEQIRYRCLVMSEGYIRNHFGDIQGYANVIEYRLADDCDMETLVKENKQTLEAVIANKLEYILIDDSYEIEIDLEG